MGRRISVRRALERGDVRPRYGDVVGDLLDVDATRAVIDTRRGLVEVALESVLIASPAPPSTADELALEAIRARNWQAADTAQLGGWLLRANEGFTQRANSVMPLRPPGVPLDEALSTARAWYAERGLPLRLQLPVEARRLLDAELGERGWAPGPDVHVLAVRLDRVTGLRSDTAVEVLPAPDDGWLGRYRDGAGASPVARGLLTRHDRVGFARVLVDGATVAIGRGAVDDEWLGVGGVEVDPAYRRTGLGRAVMIALARWGVGQGATRGHLEVDSRNAAALALYEGLGYWHHHDYRYRDDPGADARRVEAAWLR